MTQRMIRESGIEPILKSWIVIDNHDIPRIANQFPDATLRRMVQTLQFTLTGAPKVHAMEVIDQLEPTKRGLYGGACGYLSYAGDMDVAIAIRTGIVKDGMLYVQAAAGVVADSVPELEWKETEAKARALLRASELVEEGLE